MAAISNPLVKGSGSVDERRDAYREQPLSDYSRPLPKRNALVQRIGYHDGRQSECAAHVPVSQRADSDLASVSVDWPPKNQAAFILSAATYERFLQM